MTKVVGDKAVAKLNNQDGKGSLPDKYKFHSGDGSKWPPKSAWESFENMFINNQVMLGNHCASGATSNSDYENIKVYDAIQDIADRSHLDHRFILAIILQESRGCVRVPTTSNDNSNPGLMQSHKGSGTCNQDGKILNPCPVKEIYQMVEDGTMGTPNGDGLVQLLNDAKGSGAQAFYQAARMYNSGADSIPKDGDLGDPEGYATRCYASDVANRLTGWIKAKTDCPWGGGN